MSTGLYKIITSGDTDLLKDPGYNKAWISLLSDFTTLNEPAPSGSPVSGDNYKILIDHVWKTSKGAIPCFVNADILEVPGESSGDVGSQRMIWRPNILLIGDSAAQLENNLNYLNEDLVVFVSDGCPTPTYLQFGCDCRPAKMEKLAFASGQAVAGGQKGYILTVRSLCKYFYSGDIVERPGPEEEG